MSQQPRRYRVRVYEGNREALADRRYLAALDLTPGPGLRFAEAKLDELLFALAWADGARGEKIRNYRLVVHEWDEPGRMVCDWPATNVDVTP